MDLVQLESASDLLSADTEAQRLQVIKTGRLHFLLSSLDDSFERSAVAK